MLLKRLSIGAGAFVAGLVGTHVLYAINEDGDLANVALFKDLLFAATIATLIFCACRFLVTEGRAKFLGTALSYLTWASFLLLRDHGAETLMWLPVIVMFGVLFTAPILVGSWYASRCFLPERASH